MNPDHPALPNVLIAPLNWGLGHATRCIPLINAFLEKGRRPVLASDGAALELLKKEFPQLSAIELPSYDIRYDGNNMIWTMGKQLPKIVNAIRAEHRTLAKIVKNRHIGLVLSDSRFGLYHSGVHSIFMTHQLNIKVPNALLEQAVGILNRRIIRQFDEVWVPDFPKKPRLAGTLSDNTAAFPNLTYIGPLSRLERKKVAKKYDLIAVLSGPEPQRTIFQNIIIHQLQHTEKQCLLVLGRPNLVALPEVTNSNITILPYLTSQGLNEAILASDTVVCRSGYSSLMDLVKLGKRALLIPTPGQTEQVYLAAHLSEQYGFVFQRQKALNLQKGIHSLEQKSTMEPLDLGGFGLYKSVVQAVY